MKRTMRKQKVHLFSTRVILLAVTALVLCHGTFVDGQSSCTGGSLSVCLRWTWKPGRIPRIAIIQRLLRGLAAEEPGEAGRRRSSDEKRANCFCLSMCLFVQRCRTNRPTAWATTDEERLSSTFRISSNFLSDRALLQRIRRYGPEWLKLELDGSRDRSTTLCIRRRADLGCSMEEHAPEWESG
jgi:hypothetical protein